MSTPRLLRVLIVEDDPDDEELLVLELRRGGYEVEHERVDTEPAMREALAQHGWDVILSDHSLPRFSGPKALEVLGDTGLDIPFIIVSGTVGEEAAVAAMRSGASDYLLKKSLARLCPAIDRELREAASRAEQSKMREQLLISDRMASVGVLAAGVAHEINNPLAAIIANLDLIARDVDEIGEELGIAARLGDLHSEIADASEGAQRLRNIVRDLRLFSRPASEDHVGLVDLRRVMESSLRMAWNEIRHRARLIKEYGDVPPVEGNEARLGQVFLNLIVNASHAIHEGNVERNTIRVSTSKDSDSGFVIVEVADTGSGIHPQDLPKIFDAFFTTKPIGVGTGLGLSICHRIVTGMGGKIEVESKLGLGTSFRVLLPVSERQDSDKPAQPSSPVPGRRGRLLAIDDEEIVIRAISRSLGREHEVVVVTSGASALARLRSGERFDLILCDLMMPQMTGMELFWQLKNSIPDQAERMVFMTGGAFTPEARTFLKTRAKQGIEKPLDMKTIHALISERVTWGAK